MSEFLAFVFGWLIGVLMTILIVVKVLRDQGYFDKEQP